MYDLHPAVLACLVVAISIYAIRCYTDPLHAIPTVGGSSLPGLSYLGAFRTLRNFKKMLQEGYEKYPASAFKVATFDRWLVVVSGREMVEALRKRREEELSTPLGNTENLQFNYIFDAAVLSDRYHRDVAREKLLKKLYSVLPDAIDEVLVAIKDYIPARDIEWTSIELTPAVGKILARASNRTFVGLPLCRDEAFLGVAIAFTRSWAKQTAALRRVPDFLKCFVAPFVVTTKDCISRAVSHIRPLFEQRMRALEGFWEEGDDKPNDALQWMLEKGIPKGETVSAITQRLLVFNLASVGTSSNVMTHALCRLADTPPDLVGALREEVQACISADGWTGTALGRMWKPDSLLRETMRCDSAAPVTMNRKVVKDTTLLDGTRLPAGTLVAVNARALHHDASLLADAHTFDAFRYARMRSGAGQSLRNQFTSTSAEYIAFGHGPRACPGRFFASNILKAALAYILLNYDLKPEAAGDGSCPPNARRVLFKRRAV